MAENEDDCSQQCAASASGLEGGSVSESVNHPSTPPVAFDVEPIFGSQSKESSANLPTVPADLRSELAMKALAEKSEFSFDPFWAKFENLEKAKDYVPLENDKAKRRKQE